MSSQNQLDIQTEFTPNPHSLKFNLNAVILPKGSAFFETKDDADKVSPLASALFSIPKVKSVLLGKNFVTISRDPSVQTWASFIEPVNRVLQQFLTDGKSILAEGAEPALHGKIPENDTERRIMQVLDQYVRPAIARDGGDIIFHGFKDGVVTLYLQGACSTCPSSIATLKSGVERMLCEYVPEVREVHQVV